MSEPTNEELHKALAAANAIIAQQADEMKRLQDELDALLYLAAGAALTPSRSEST